MKRNHYFLLCGLLLLPAGSMQAQTEFNPVTPPDPQVPVFYYPLTVSCNPTTAGSASGRGNYAPGTVVRVSTSANAGYIFNHWELNGEPYEATTASFNFTTTDGNMDFVAVYDFQPYNPSDPLMDVKSRLYLASEPEGICTFNLTSGAWVEADTYIALNVTNADQWYEFTGWYLNDVLITTEQSFNYLANYNDETLVARFCQLPFTPSLPGDPMHQDDQTDVQIYATGDANEDGNVNVTDAVAVINAYLTEDNTGINVNLADVNHDGVINISDAVAIINIYLNSQ